MLTRGTLLTVLLVLGLVLVVGGGFSFQTSFKTGVESNLWLRGHKQRYLDGSVDSVVPQPTDSLHSWGQGSHGVQVQATRTPKHGQGCHHAHWKPQNAGVYNWTSLPRSLAPVLNALFSPLSDTQPTPIVASVRDKASGAADRIRGLLTLAQLALVCGRKLRVEPDYLRSSSGAGDTVNTTWGEGRYVAAVDCSSSEPCPWGEFASWALENPGHALVVNTNSLETLVHADVRHDLGQHFNSSTPGAQLARRLVRVCSATLTIRTSCGAMLLHAAWGSSNQTAGQVSSLKQASLMQTVWADRFPDDGYSMLHMRAASAPLTVHGENTSVSVPSVAFIDGHASSEDRVDLVLSELRRHVGARQQSCSTPLAVASDSPRFIGELTFAVGSSAHIATCCGGGWHVARLHHAPESTKLAAENQVFFDLISLARAQEVFCVVGGFGRLGRVFLSFGTAWSDFRCCTESACLPEMVEQMWGSLRCVATSW